MAFTRIRYVIIGMVVKLRNDQGTPGSRPESIIGRLLIVDMMIIGAEAALRQHNTRFCEIVWRGSFDCAVRVRPIGKVCMIKMVQERTHGDWLRKGIRLVWSGTIPQ